MNHRVFIIFSLLALPLGACLRGQILDGEALPNAYACYKDACDNPIDPVLNPIFTCRLTPLAKASERELCRRLFVDTVGRVATDEDFATMCEGRTLTQILDDLLASPEYVRQRQKQWAARFGYNDARSWYANTIGLDELVGKLYRDELTLADFTARAAIHPGLLTSADGAVTAYVERSANPRIKWTIDDVEFDDELPLEAKGPDADAYVERVFETLLLRSPDAEELSEFANLYRQYEIAPHEPDPNVSGFSARRLKVQPCNCAGAKGVFCQMTSIAVRSATVPLRNPSASECDDAQAFLIEDASDQELGILRAPGEELARRPDFYRNHARDVLDRLLGYDAIAALGPTVGEEVLTALATAFSEDGSVRNLEAAIFKSALYRQAQSPPQDSPPVDCNGKPGQIYAGPRKRLDTEAYLSSVLAVTGADLGRCDHRLQLRPYEKELAGATSGAFAPDGSLFPIDSSTGAPDFSYRDLARSVGGCLDNVNLTPIVDSGAFMQMGYDFVVRDACEKGGKSAPAMSGNDDEALAATVDYQFSRFFLEKPTADERALGVEAMKGCLSDADTCPNVGHRMCAALLKSARFMTY